MANAHGIATAGLDIRSDDRGVSWLPLYHDMGLVGFMLVPLMCQLSTDYLATRDFARRSLTWLQLFNDNGGSLPTARPSASIFAAGVQPTAAHLMSISAVGGWQVSAAI